MDRTLPSLFAQLDDYLTAAGQARAAPGDPGDALRAARREHPAFSRPESFAAAKEALESPATDARKKERLELLLPFLGEEVVDAFAEDADAARRALERMAQVALGDERLGFAEALRRLPVEVARERRGLVQKQLGDLLLDQQSTYARRVEAAARAAEALWFPSYRALLEATSGAPLEPLLGACSAALARSEDAYRDLLAFFLRKLELRLRPLPGGGGQRHDLLRLGALEAPFTRADLLPVALRWLSELGFSPDAERRIRMDPAAPDSEAIPIEVPGRILLRIASGVGAATWRGALHALGHAQHLAGAGEELPPERRRLGDPAVGLSHGLLFEQVLHDEAWLRRYLRLSQGESREAARLAAFLQLTRLRECCAQLAFEVELYERGPSHAMADAYVERLQGALGVSVHPGFFLRSVTPHLRAAAHARAFALEAALRAQLEERFNEDHWRNPGARAFLSARFAQGQPRHAEAPDVARAAERLVAVMGR